MFSQAILVALPFMSAAELAAVGEVLAALVVLVVSTLVLEMSTEKTSAATCLIFEFTPWPISIAPVLIPILPSV